MKIVRAPLRITLGGGGTDLPNWYREHGGFLVTAAIDKFIYVTGSRRVYDDKIWLSYSKVEVCDGLEEIHHELFRTCLREFNLGSGIELHSISELPGNTGLGSSGAFLVAVLKVLCEMEARALSVQEIAELACRIEMVDLSRSSGKQDPYASAFGGITTMTIGRDGKVIAEPLKLPGRTLRTLNNNLKIYSTGIARQSEEVLSEQGRDLGGKRKSAVDAMRRIQEIGYESRDCLLSGDLDRFGALMHEHWLEKKSISDKMSAASIDSLYAYALDHGALGGKIIGAGGGGFLMVYVPTSKHAEFDEAMIKLNCKEMDWHFSDTGATMIYSL